MTLQQAMVSVRELDQAAMWETKKRLDSIVKPLDSLGLLEQHLIKVAGITGRYTFDFSHKAVVVFCADNGVVAQGITQSGQEVTAVVSENMATGDTCLCAMARVASAKVIAVDVGIAREMHIPGLLQKKVAWGTADFTQAPAMSREQAVAAVEVGIQMAEYLSQKGFALLATGEMGIGNTATSAAIASAVLELPPEQTTGRGAGLSDEGLARKVAVVKKGLEIHRPNKHDGLDLLAKVGGLDIAAMAGLCIGGAVFGVPIVLDGFISVSAALVAQRICPAVVNFLLPSHLSPEPACGLALRFLGLEPPLHAGMRLGEGTGAVATFPLYDMIASVYSNMVTFSDEAMEAYQPF